MTPTMVISCPECNTKIRAPASAIGKKIRCKACEHTFAVKPPAKSENVQKKPDGKGKPPPAKEAKPSPIKEGTPPPKPVPFEEDADDDGKAYGIIEADLGHRCPQCAAEMDGPEAVVCLNCGFNSRTRTMTQTRRIKDITGQDKFLWLLPGILCAVAVVLLITYWCIHTLVLPSSIWSDWDSLVQAKGRNKAWSDEAITGWYSMFFHSAFCGLLALIFAWLSWKLGRFAFERLVLHPTPPESEVK